MHSRRYPAPAIARPWWRTEGSCAGCAIHIEYPGPAARAMSSPTFRECPPSAAPHFRNHGGRPVRPLAEWSLSEFAPRRPAPDRRRFHLRDLSRAVFFAKSPTASLLLPYAGCGPPVGPLGLFPLL